MKKIVSIHFLKRSIFGFFLIVSFYSTSQTHDINPEKTFSNCDLNNPVKYTKTVTYSVIEQGWKPELVSILSFNSTGQIIQDYQRVVGEFSSETIYNYVYKNGLLDSIHRYASAANFNVESHFKRDGNGRIVLETAKGFYVDYTKKYEYESTGKLKSITTLHDHGHQTHTSFVYGSKGILDYIKYSEGQTSMESNQQLFWYDGEELFANWNEKDSTFYFSPSKYQLFLLKKEPNTFDKITLLRSLKNTNKPEFERLKKEIIQKAERLEERIDSTNEKGDWTKLMIKSMANNQENKSYSFREIAYTDGATSGSTDFDSFFYQRTKSN